MPSPEIDAGSMAVDALSSICLPWLLKLDDSTDVVETRAGELCLGHHLHVSVQEDRLDL